MNEIIEKEMINIENMIYEVRGVQVMISSDVAKIYQVETKRINEVIKRNIKRFPDSFCFQLTNEEIESLFSRSQFATLNKNNNLRGSNIKYLPYVLTEQGIMMLSGLLKSDVAVQVNIQIINAFVRMRHYINYTKDFLPHKILLIEDKVDNNTKRIDELFDKFDPKDIIKDKIFFEGEFYKAYSVFIDILNRASEEIIIIDNYASKELLDILKDIKTKIIIVSSNIDETLKKKYEKEYSNVTFKLSDEFHDRFIIIDRRRLYHSGASFKDIGKKCFAINEFGSDDVREELLSKIFLDLKQ